MGEYDSVCTMSSAILSRSMVSDDLFENAM